MAYHHGVRVLENPTSLTVPIYGTAGLQVIFGTAPVNLAADPYGCTNKPILATSLKEAASGVGYCNVYDFKKYTLCQSIDLNFQKVGVGPIILVNVLDPKVHKKDLKATEAKISDGQATVEAFGILADKVTVKSGETELKADTDFITTFDDDGFLVLTFTTTDAAAAAIKAGTVTVSGSGALIDPDAVDENDIIGSYNVSTGEEKGLEILRQVFPKLQMTPGLIVAPYWSKFANVAAAIGAKCEGINGVFSCEAVVDLDTSEDGGARVYTDVFTVKNASAMVNKHEDIEWPCIKIGTRIYHASAYKAAVTAYTDANNGDVPNLSPSNKAAAISGLCLEDGTEVVIDEQQANIVNSFGVCTFSNFSGWVTWGNNTAAYPGSTDPKDRWFCCRRFFSWWGNSFILTYHQRVDNPASMRLIESIIDDENVKGASLVAQGRCAGAVMEFNEEENTVNDILNGTLKFHQRLAPYPPAEDILNVLEYDPALLEAALSGGE